MACSSTSIDRPLTEDEASLVRWMLEQAGPQAAPFLAQFDQARAAWECSCGCASIGFTIGGVRPLGKLRVLHEFSYRVWFGVAVHAHGEILSELETWSVAPDGASAPLPTIAELSSFSGASDRVSNR